MRALLGGLGRGLAVGLAWGVLARVFMRLVSTEPSFSWAGTIAILGFAGVFWGLVGLVVAARSAGRRPWWRLAPIPGLILFAGPGMVLLPGAVVAAVGLALRRQVLRLSVLALGGAGTFWLLTVLDDDRFLAPRTQTLGHLLVAVSVVWLGAGFHAWWRRWPASAATPTLPAGPATGDVGDHAGAGGDLPSGASPTAYGH